MFKIIDFIFFATFLIAGVISLVLAFICASGNLGKIVSFSGLLFTVSGLFQLEFSGLFNKVIDEYSDDKKYPYGPPSFITRKIIDNPDTPIRTWLKINVLFNLKSGFYIIVFGTLLQAFGVWI